MAIPIKYAAYLQAQAREISSIRSARKTRLRLWAALALLLEKTDFNDITVADITEKAGLAKGTFFIYFKAKDDIVAELLSRFVEFERSMLPPIELGDDPFQGILQIISWYEKTFALNHGILRCLVRLSSTEVQYSQMWSERNSAVLDQWAPQVLVWAGLACDDLNMLRQIMHSLGAIVDQSLFERYGLVATGSAKQPDLEDLIEMHAVLMYRAILGTDPPLESVHYMKPLLMAAKH